MSKRHAPPILREVASVLRSSGYTATIHYLGKGEDRPGILVTGHGRHEIVSEGDRGYRWRNDAGRLSEDYFTHDLYAVDEDGVDEIANALFHLLED
jgi:hypothetical protein